MSQWRVCLHYKLDKLHMGPHQQEYEQHIKASYLFPLTGTGKAAPGLLHPGWCLLLMDVDKFDTFDKSSLSTKKENHHVIAQPNEEEWTKEEYIFALQ